MDALLQVNNLSLSIGSGKRRGTVVRNLNLMLNPGERLGLVGESGSGKSLTALAIMGLLSEAVEVEAGEIHLMGNDLLKLDARAMRHVRGKDISMIFQEPLTALNPVMKVGDQISEILLEHNEISAQDAREEAIRLLDSVGIRQPTESYRRYPHEFSGGMRQRVMIAMAVACRPRLLIADEPTTALDVTVQAQIIQLLDRLQQDTGVAILLISHNLALVGSFCNRIAVMHAGDVVETGKCHDVLVHPCHPTQRLYWAACLRNWTISGETPCSMKLPARSPRLPIWCQGAVLLSDARRHSPAAPTSCPGCATTPIDRNPHGIASSRHRDTQHLPHVGRG